MWKLLIASCPHVKLISWMSAILPSGNEVAGFHPWPNHQIEVCLRRCWLWHETSLIHWEVSLRDWSSLLHPSLLIRRGSERKNNSPWRPWSIYSLLALLQDCRMSEHVTCKRARQAREGEDNVLVHARLPFYLERNRTYKARNSFYPHKYNFSPEDVSG